MCRYLFLFVIMHLYFWRKNVSSPSASIFLNFRYDWYYTSSVNPLVPEGRNIYRIAKISLKKGSWKKCPITTASTEIWLEYISIFSEKRLNSGTYGLIQIFLGTSCDTALEQTSPYICINALQVQVYYIELHCLFILKASKVYRKRWNSWKKVELE